MIRFVGCAVVILIIIGVVLFVTRDSRKPSQEVQQPPGERIDQPGTPPAAPGAPSIDVTQGGVPGLRQYLRSSLDRPTRRNRAGKRFLLGFVSGDYVIIVRLPSGVTWRYVCTPDALWGAQRPASDCVLADSANTGSLDLQRPEQIEGLLRDLVASYPV